MLVLTKQHQRNVLFLSICPLRRAVCRKSLQVRPAPSMTQKPFAGVERDVFVFAVNGCSLRIQRPARSMAEVGRRWGYFSQHFVDAGECGYLLEQLPSQIKLHVKTAPAASFDALSSLPIVEQAYRYLLAELLADICRSYGCMGHHEKFGNVSEKRMALQKKMLDTLATNPVNIYEYLTAGKSGACVDLPEIDRNVAKNG